MKKQKITQNSAKLLLEYITKYYKADSLQGSRFKAFEYGIPTSLVGRKVVKTAEIVFSASLNQLQEEAHQGKEAEVLLGSVVKNLAPRKPIPSSNMSDFEKQVLGSIERRNYDLSNAIVNSVTITNYNNGFPITLGLKCNAVPKVYQDMGQKELGKLAKYFSDGSNIGVNKHIPASGTVGSRMEERMSLIKQMPNGYNSSHISRSFGALRDRKDFLTGLVELDKQTCFVLKLPEPERKYVIGDGVDVSSLSQQQKSQLEPNTWVLVPAGHAHSWITTIEPLTIYQMGYEIWPLRVDEKTVPFFLIDKATIIRMSVYMDEEIIKKIDRRDIRNVGFSIFPFGPSSSSTTLTASNIHSFNNNNNTQIEFFHPPTKEGSGGEGSDMEVDDSQEEDEDGDVKMEERANPLIHQENSFAPPKWTDYKNVNPSIVYTFKMSVVIEYTVFPILPKNYRYICALTPGFPPMNSLNQPTNYNHQ